MDTSLVRLHRELNAEKLEFRLLEFSPQAKHSDLIHFDLIYAILLDPPEYETLSYTWGAPYEGLPPEWDDPEPSIPISLNGTVHHIHHNLAAFLQTFATLATDGKPRRIWIDALCIDQTSALDKAYQLPLMGKIYSSSQRTIVWTGPPTDDSSLAADTIAKWAKLWQIRPVSLKEQFISPDDAIIYEFFLQGEIAVPHVEQRLAAVVNFFLRNWWRRAWIVQEVVLSKSVVFYFGDSVEQTIDFRDVASVWRLVSQHFAMSDMSRKGAWSGIFSRDATLARLQDLHDVLYTVGNAAWRYQRINNLLEKLTMFSKNESPKLVLRTNDAENHDPDGEWKLTMYNDEEPVDPAATLKPIFPDLPDALYEIASTQAKMPHDKIHAARCIAQKSDFVAVNYEQPADNFFTDITRLWIEREHDLDILDYCTFVQGSNLPSWAVDWSRPSHRVPFPKKRRLCLEKSVYTCLSIEAETFASFTEDGSVMVSKGFIRDIVSFVGRKSMDEEVEVQRMLQFKSFDKLFSFSKTKHNNDQTRLDDINSWLHDWMSTLKTEPKVVRGFQNPRTGETNFFYVTFDQSLQQALRRTLMADVLLGDDHEVLGRTSSNAEAGWEPYLSRAVTSTLPGRTFFATELGLMGLAPIEVQVGDRVCSIVGRETPLVLRKVDERYWNLVGECYVHGIMDGEVLSCERLEGGSPGKFEISIRDFEIK